jgi:hypothetical protein
MNINVTDANAVSGFYAVDLGTFCDTMEESIISFTQDMGGVVIHHGTRNGAPIWLMDNPTGKYGIWVEENEHRPN